VVGETKREENGLGNGVGQTKLKNTNGLLAVVPTPQRGENVSSKESTRF
jgi:hypothetical protein